MSKFILTEKVKKKREEKKMLKRMMKKKREEEKMLKRMRKKMKERKEKLRAARANGYILQQKELKRFAKKEKMHTLTAMIFLSEEKQAKAQRDRNMDNKEYNVTLLNISIQEENMKNDRLAEEERKPMVRFWASWDHKQFVRSRMGKKQKEEVENNFKKMFFLAPDHW
jgi:hypothetical protein